jgi:hypothetical protein
MAKLHELLAVNTNLENQATKTRTDLMATFEKKRHLFEQKLVTFKPNTEGAPPVTEAQSDIQSTVRKEIEWISGIMAKTVDVGHQIDIAMTQAKADIVTENGDTLLKDVPATSLLQLEKRVKEVHDIIAAIPTLDPAKGFAQDDAREKGIFRAREVNKTRTKKTATVLVKYQATKEHPAQTELIAEDLPVGTIVEQEWSSLLTPAMKSVLLDHCEVVTRAVKRARARANELELDVASHKIGKKVLDFIFQPLA